MNKETVAAFSANEFLVNNTERMTKPSEAPVANENDVLLKSSGMAVNAKGKLVINEGPAKAANTNTDDCCTEFKGNYKKNRITTTNADHFVTNLMKHDIPKVESACDLKYFKFHE